MGSLRKYLGLGALLVAAAWSGAASAGEASEAAEPPAPRIQVAILLDTSGSMDGLIEQAKTQLWKIVNEFIFAEKDGRKPQLEVALYSYGMGSEGDGGFMQRLLPLTTDLDKVSEKLFALRTSGSAEYCGWVIQRATRELAWSASTGDLKVICIAGNEEFTQGKVDYRESCKEAASKGIVVNTIHCGNEAEGVSGKWKDGALLADGTYSFIDQNRAVVHVNAPQDAKIAELGEALNKTYVPFGAAGADAAARQVAQDANASKSSMGSYVQRQVTKANAFYVNANWDLVDAVQNKQVRLAEVKEADLPENMRKMDAREREAYVGSQLNERQRLQKEINTLNLERQKYVDAETKKQAEAKGKKTLDAAMSETLRAQAAKREFRFGSK